MEENLTQIAKKYVDVIEEIEKTSDKEKLERLEELRVQCHLKFIESLNKQGIEYRDRDHATRIAYKFAKQEL